MKSNSSIKLHLGCGTRKLEGWINIDSVYTCQPDVVHDITEPLEYEDLSVDEILAEDLLEHFDKYMRHIVFYEWARVLKIGGKITIQVPDFKKILRRYFKFGFRNFVDFIFGENLWESCIYIGHFGNHKWGYSEKTLKEFVELYGIDVISLKKENLNLKLVGEKHRHITADQLKNVEIYSHANKCGDKKAFVPLSFVEKKIREYKESQSWVKKIK